MRHCSLVTASNGLHPGQVTEDGVLLMSFGIWSTHLQPGRRYHSRGRPSARLTFHPSILWAVVSPYIQSGNVDENGPPRYINGIVNCFSVPISYTVDSSGLAVLL